MAGLLLSGHLHPDLGSQFRWNNSLGLLARRLAGNGPALGILGLYHNPGGGGFLSLVELNKFRKAWAHLFNDSMNFGFIDLTVMQGLACGAEAIISR